MILKILNIILNDKHKMLLPIPKFKEIFKMQATYRRDEQISL